MTLFKSLIGALTKPQRPMHAGEVMGAWTAILALSEGRSMLEGLLHHIQDAELKRFVEQYVADFDTPWIDRFREFMLARGIPLPEQSPEKPRVIQGEVPPGARFSDAEVAQLMASKIVGGLQIIHQSSVQCLRYDLGVMLVELHAATYKQAFVLREMMDRRGWLQIPPTWPQARVGE